MNQSTTTNFSVPFMDDINAIDFTMIKLKLMDKEEGAGWTKSICDEAEIEYRRFLVLKRTYPEKDIVPHKTIDVFWHQHILDTEKYAADCEIIFGKFLHHFPYFGMADAQDKQNLIDAFEVTKEIYYKHFGCPYLGEAPKCKAPKCRTACKPVKCR